jgi:hypothetical protein
VAAPEETLEALVRDELRAPVAALVRRLVPELVAEALNGHRLVSNISDTAAAEASATAAKTCRVCGRQDVRFDRGRRVCRDCRRAQVRERAARRQADDEEPHPARGPQEGRKSQRRLDSDRAWAARRRALIEQARVTTEERDGREYVVRHLAPQFQSE